ncbi:hypothetical protein [Paenibacillus tepidiphilus]|uniref:hypothetical protein n=1 Tax=Paenibacillus tepidiphilus TaxID=2608683 RepID=UPI00123A7A54|nr:hypothetical protein [Paenibacillus tepidiphilus]
MADHISEIWHADMKQNGLMPLIKDLSEHEAIPEEGYVVVDMNPFPTGNPEPRADQQVNVIKKVVIPEHKLISYDLFKTLHDNYNWRRNQNDPTPQKEWDEIQNFLKFAITTAPMEIAREFAASKGYISGSASDEEWIDKLTDLWFAQYEGNSTSLFEHVFIGEEGGTSGRDRVLSGHHFWYHYYINDGPFEVTTFEDSIAFLKHVEVVRSEVSNLAEIITIKYIYTKKDGSGELDLLKTPKGGFFVGLSTEGLLAMGTVAFLEDVNDTDVYLKFDLNGERYSLTVWRTKDNHKHPRTFFPVIEQPVPVG